MSKQIIAYGATVKRARATSAGAAGSYAPIPESKGIAIPVVQQDYVEVTSLDSPNGFKEYIKGLKDAGEITIPCGYTAAAYEQQLGDQAEKQAIFYEVVLDKQVGQATTGDKFVFRGFPVPELEVSGLGEPIGINIKIRTTGDVAWTKGS